MSEDGQCPICCDEFNRSSRVRVPCEFGDCKYAACKTCVRQYLLTTTSEPHCMQCRKPWTQAYVTDSLNRTWVSGEYRRHHSKLLLERELSRMPDTMEAAELERRARETEKRKEAIMAQIVECRARERELLRKLRSECRDSDEHWSGEAATRREFTMACPVADCRGFLSSQYKCGICAKTVCKKCMVPLDRPDGLGHTCDPDVVASTEAIRKETRPCPGCGERIYKLSGCDQMWCPSCHTAFSWRTGKVDSGVVHNPEFYRWHRENEGSLLEREDDRGCCRDNAPPSYRTMLRSFRSPYALPSHISAMSDMAMCIHQFITHCTSVEHPRRTAQLRRAGDTQALRVKYLLNDIDKDELEAAISKNDRARKKCTDIVNVHELLTQEGSHILSQIARTASRLGRGMQSAATYTSRSAELDGFFEAICAALGKDVATFFRLVALCNDLFRRAGRTHGTMVPVITFDRYALNWELSRTKYSVRAPEECPHLFPPASLEQYIQAPSQVKTG